MQSLVFALFVCVGVQRRVYMSMCMCARESGVASEEQEQERDRMTEQRRGVVNFVKMY